MHQHIQQASTSPPEGHPLLTSIFPSFHQAPSKQIRSSPCISLRRNFHASASSTHGKRPRGFWNLGRSCHLSATLVALSAIPAFHSYVRRALSAEEEKEYGVDEERIQGLKAMTVALEEAVGLRGGQGGVNPRDVARWIERRGVGVGYRIKEDQDAYETFGQVLEVVSGDAYDEKCREDGLNVTDECSKEGVYHGGEYDRANGHLGGRQHQNCKREREKEKGEKHAMGGAQPLVSPFEGLLATVRRCKNCRYSPGMRLESFRSLSLSLPDSRATTVGITLEDCLWETYGKANILDGVPCTACSGTHHELHSNIARLPQVLCLHLQRIVWHESSPYFITAAVTYPKTLHVPSRWMRNSDTDPIRPPVRKYSLEAVVQHHGNYKGGHYTALRSYPRGGESEGGLSCVLPAAWYLLNDDKSFRVDASAANSTSAYLLFYVAHSKENATER